MYKKLIKIGCDPEFIITKNGKLADLDEIGAIELDGSDNCHEIRPEASKNPLEVVSNIHKIFIEQIKGEDNSFNNYWMAGSYYAGQPLGGHIHISADNCSSEIENPPVFIHFMEQYLGVICLLLEKRKDGLKRRSAYWNYGKYCSMRNNGITVELRSPASWLTSPQIAAAILCLAKIVANEYINNNKRATKEYINERQFNKMLFAEIRPKFPEIWAEIEKMELFSEYEEYVSIIPELIKNKLTFFPKCSFKEAWGLVQFENPKPKVKLSFNPIWKPWIELNNL